tara:strand:- start:379 stop:1113 length:735 start_codon:yes stop_codon:yes gene_type:complete
MALKTINLGSVANDGTGDDLREAFEKVVFNFSDLDARTPEATTVSTLGSGSSLYFDTNVNDLRFKSLIGGTNATLISTDNDITINVDAGVTQFIVAGDTGSLTVTENTTVTMQGGTLITTTRDGNNIRIDSSALGSLSQDPAPQLSASLNANGQSIGNIQNLTAVAVTGNLTGNVTGNVHNIDIRDLDYYRQPTNSWNFGSISNITVTNIYDFLIKTADVDFGGISTSQPNVTLDAGSINTPAF